MLSVRTTGGTSTKDEGARRRVLFVCRATVEDGMGHVTRTRAVAQSMRKLAQVEVVAVGGAPARNLLADSGLEHTVARGAEDASRVSRRFEPDVVVFDLLGLDAGEFAAGAGDARTASLSPIFDHLADVDVVFHRTAVPDPSWPARGWHPELRMGLEYAVITDHCRRIPTRVYRETLAREHLSVAVSMGGSDAANKTLEIIKTLRTNRRKLLLWILLGEGYSHSYQDLVDCARGARQEIILAKTNESMWHILGTCALCILAGGTTSYQAAFAGLPSLNALESGDRRFLIQELDDRGACIRLGDDMSASLASLNATIERLDEDRSELLDMHRKSRGLVDGKGAGRIAREILALAEDPEDPDSLALPDRRRGNQSPR
jgi:spore coat polysaccharide biosynthesis predicted glycosyltransferase SpsG